MQASVHHQHGPPDVPEPRQRLARVSGLLYLIIAVFGMFSPLVLTALVAPGDAATTADRILNSRWLFGSSLVTWIVVVVADITVSIMLYLLLEPVSRALSLVVAALRLVYSAILGAVLLNLYDAFLLLTGAARGAGFEVQQRQIMALAALDTFSTGFLLALVFFGTHLAALGILFHRSRLIPRALAILLVAGGVGYMVDSLAKVFVADHGGLATAVLLAPALIGELGLTAWLLIKGVKIRREAATENPSGTRPTPADARIPAITGATGGLR